MKSKQVAPLFYFGMLISSIGSFAFNLSLIAFMLKSGFPLWQASLIIGLQRLVPVLVVGIWGHITDNLPVRSTVVAAEGIAAIASLILLSIWSGPNTIYPLLVLVCIVRSLAVFFQTGSRAKITKFLSNETYKENSKHAIWLSKATQGATLFGGVFAWVIIRYFNLETAIIFDGATFLLNGLIVLLLPRFEEKPEPLANWKQKFSDLFTLNRDAAILDILLAVSMMGTVIYQSRLAANNQSWMGLFQASFGLAVWVSGYLERGITSKLPTLPYWLTLGAAYLCLGQMQGPSILTLLFFFVKDLSYWIIFHRISSHIQVYTPTAKMGGVSSARSSIMISILASGEMMVGAWSGVLPIASESTMRALFAVCVAIGIFLVKRKVVALDRPAL